MAEESDVDVTAAIDQFDDEWSDDDNNEASYTQSNLKKTSSFYQENNSDDDTENRPPINITTKKSIAQPSKFSTIPEESQSHYSSYRYSQQGSNNGTYKSSDRTEKTTNPALFTIPEVRKNSISFARNLFTKCDDFERMVQQKKERERHQNSYLNSRPNVSNKPVSSRSTTPPNRSTISISHNSSKPLTSTPIAERYGSRLNSNVSRARERSKSTSQNESSLLSESKINFIIKGIDLDQSSIRNAKNFVLQSKHIPKPSKILEDIKKKREQSKILEAKRSSLRMNSSLSNARQNRVLPVPTLPRVLEQNRFSNRPSTSTTISHGVIAIKPNPISNWGFVAIGEEVQAKIFLRNSSSHIVEVIPRLSDQISYFKLASNGSVQIHPNCSEEFTVIFIPTECKRYHYSVKFYVSNSGKTYSHTLLGYGGTAHVKIIEKRSLSYFPRSGFYRFALSNISSFGFEVENYGDRAAFVHIVAVDSNGIESRSIRVAPKSFCLVPKTNNQNDPSKANIAVEVPENYVQQMCRMSMDSVKSSTSSIARNNIFSLKVYFGDERLRQRAKKYSDDINHHENIQGLWLTKTQFGINGQEMNALDNYFISIQDLEILQTQTRVLTLLIADDRMEKRGINSLSSRPQSSSSHRGFIDNGYNIPQCNNEGDSTMISVADSDRTIMN